MCLSINPHHTAPAFGVHLKFSILSGSNAQLLQTKTKQSTFLSSNTMQGMS